MIEPRLPPLLWALSFAGCTNGAPMATAVVHVGRCEWLWVQLLWQPVSFSMVWNPGWAGLFLCRGEELQDLVNVIPERPVQQLMLCLVDVYAEDCTWDLLLLIVRQPQTTLEKHQNQTKISLLSLKLLSRLLLSSSMWPCQDLLRGSCPSRWEQHQWIHDVWQSPWGGAYRQHCDKWCGHLWSLTLVPVCHSVWKASSRLSLTSGESLWTGHQSSWGI